MVLKNETCVCANKLAKDGGQTQLPSIKLDESMPDSLNKLFYAKQKALEKIYRDKYPDDFSTGR